jgi:hypothetical protein
VVHLDSGREMRGGQWQVLQLLEHLRSMGVAQALLTPKGSPLFARAQEAGIDTKPLSLGSLWRESRRADLLHAHDARCHTLGALTPGKPLVVSRRVAFAVRDSALSRWKYRRAAAYLAVSEYVKRQLMAAGVPASKIETVHDGVTIPERPASGTKVIALRSADPGKGSSLIREAASIAAVQVRFSDDLVNDLAHAAIFVYVSYSEGLGSAALLASAYGIPVIASNIGGLPEAVKNGETGLLTENDPRRIAHAIQVLIGDPAFARRLGNEGRERMKRSFTMESTAQATRRAYEKVLGC